MKLHLTRGKRALAFNLNDFAVNHFAILEWIGLLPFRRFCGTRVIRVIRVIRDDSGGGGGPPFIIAPT